MVYWPWQQNSIATASLNPIRPTVKASLNPFNSAVMNTGGMEVPIGDAYSLPVSRELALSVPAVNRGLFLICSTIAALPMKRRDANGNFVDAGWLKQPEAGRPGFNTWFDIALDLRLNAVAYLRVTDRDTNGQPTVGGCEYIELTRVGAQYDNNKILRLTIDGVVQNPANIIGFQGLGKGLLVEGARTIRTAIALEAAAKRYADAPLPASVLENISGFELTDEEIDSLIENFKRSRNQEGVGYTNGGVKVNTLGWDARQLQLVEARQFSNTQLANLIGLPSRYMAGAAAASGGSITYANVTQDNRELVDFSLKPVANVLESRLSMMDAAGPDVEVDMDRLLRGNPMERADLYSKLIPLGVLTVEEARLMEDLVEGSSL